jgi:hypothetical protein
VIGTTLQIVGENLAEACDLRCDEECWMSPPAMATPHWRRRGVAVR